MDSIPDARGGFSENFKEDVIEVVFEENVECLWQDEIAEILSYDPRPQYQTDENRVYGFKYKGHNVKFVYQNGKIVVKEII